MKRICLILTSLFLLCGWVAAQNETISFNETEHDFGVIGEKDGTANFVFVITNRSKEPVVITKVATSCGCTTPMWTKEPVEPGKQGQVSVSYNPLGRIGSFSKTITVYINQGTPNYVRIKGEVVSGKKKINPQEIYPVAFGDYLLKSKELSFGQVGWKAEKIIRLEVFNNSAAPMTQKVLKLPKYLSVTFDPAILPPKTGATIDVSLNAQDENSYGNLSGDIPLLINNVHQSLSYSATVVDDFSQWASDKKANAGKINVSLTEINFGNFSSSAGKTLKISNSGKSALTIRAIQSTDPAVTVSKTRLVINPNEIAELTVNADSKKIQSNALSAKLMIFSDDPNMPVYPIPVTANK